MDKKEKDLFDAVLRAKGSTKNPVSDRDTRCNYNMEL